MNTRLITGLASLTLVATLGGVNAHGAWILVDDFESHSATYPEPSGAGSLSGQGTWVTSGSGAYRSRVDPNGTPNKVVRSGFNTVSTQWGRLTGPTIAEGETGTLFIRARVPAGANNTFGMSRFGNSADATSEFGPWMGFQSGQSTYGVGSGTPALIEAGTYTPDTWMNYWLVIDNAANTTQLYTSTGFSDAVGAPVVGQFRNASAGTLNRILFVREAGGTQDNTWFDDIYFSPGVLTTNPIPNPIPEPSALVLGIFGLISIGCVRCRRIK